MTEKTGDGEGKIADASDVEIENAEEAKDTKEEGVAPKPKAINIRPILTFPIYNFIILVSFIVLWMLVFLKDDLFNAIETLTPVDPNPEYGKVKLADQG